ncbi:hypothetical protein KJ756_01690 [Patescibacteria group bacterium]|nr:hypothetical protein [Patescibacteria group bacterium]MCG2808863.1 hypothetical protein [Candidatus Portnoybacteria bacterium]
MNERDERAKAIDTLVEECINKGRTTNAIKAIELGASGKMVDALIKEFVTRGWVDATDEYWLLMKLTKKRTVGVLKSTNTNVSKKIKKMINALVEEYINNGWVIGAIEAAETGRRELTINEIKKLTINIK